MKPNPPTNNSEPIFRLDEDGVPIEVTRRVKRSILGPNQAKAGRARRLSERLMLGVVASVVLAGLTVAGILMAIRFNHKRTSAATTPVPPTADGLDNLSETSLTVARGFAFAPDHAARMRLVRNPGEVEEDVRRFFDSGPGNKEKFEELALLGDRGAGTLESGLQHFVFVADAGEGVSRLIHLVMTSDGLRVDFPAYARQCSHPWQDVLAGQASPAIVRVALTKEDYYNHRFDKESEWQCLRAESPDFEGSLSFYVERKTKEPSLLTYLGSLPTKRTRFVVGIRTEGDSHLHRQFVITHVLARGWVLP